MPPSPRLTEAVRRAAFAADPPPPAERLARALAEATGDALRAVVFFGSRKTQARPDSWSAYDLFVLTRDYRVFYRRLARAGGLRRSPWLVALLNAWLPPNQVSFRTGSEAGEPLHGKCAVITLGRLRRETSAGRSDHFCIGRLFQPAQVVLVQDDAAATELLAALADAHAESYGWIRPWLGARFDVEDYTRALLRVSLSKEVRPEPEGRAEALWQAQRDYLTDVYGVLLQDLAQAGELNAVEPGVYALARRVGAGERLGAALYFRWSLLRATLRWAKYVITFQDWLEYLVRKAERHSGRRIQLTSRERRLPLLFLWPRVVRFLRQKDE